MEMKGFQIIANKKSFLDGYKISEIIGREVIAKNAEVVGKIIDIVFLNHELMGVLVKRGFSKYYVDKMYFAEYTPDAILLNVDPVLLLRGKIVFDNRGKKLGRVKEVLRDSDLNDFSSLLIKGGMFSKSFQVPKKDVEIQQRNVILNRSY